MWLLVFLFAFGAEYASAVWAVNETRAVVRLQTRQAVQWGGLLLLLGWADYLAADRMSLAAAMPGSIVGGMLGTYHAVERKKVQKRLKKKRQQEDV